MTYDQADNILQEKPPDTPGKPPPPPLTAGGPVEQSIIGTLKDPLKTLTLLARKLREDREAIGGAVDLSSGDIGTELKFTLESGQPVKVASKEDKEIHSTIAELMIVANSYVASKIYKSFPDSSLLRIHRTVEENRFEDLREVLEASGIPFHGENNMALAKSLKDAERLGKSSTVVSSLIKSLATRAMSEAQYVCTGDQNQEADLSHYGLGLSFYTHFTSPLPLR
jgi:DIS3-like exonuclease 1